MKHYDLIVAGGGLTGVAAAIAGAKEGLSVLLIEKSGTLGGAITNNLVFPFMAYWTEKDGEKKFLSKGIFTEMVQRGKAYDPASTDMKFKPEFFKVVLDDMVTAYGVDVLLHSTVCGVHTEGRKLKSVDVAALSKLVTIDADFFIDATGDGNLFALAGCDFRLGRESDGLCQPMTVCFRMCGVDTDGFKAGRAEIEALYRQFQAEGKIKNPRENILVFFDIGEGVVQFNTTRIIKHDPTDVFDVTRAEMLARQQVVEMVNFLKENSPAFAHSTLVSIATEIGIRESRKLKGEHVLTVEELKNLTVFDDAIALGNYDVDIHNPEGAGTSHHRFSPGEYYTIPYRSLLPKEYDNLLVAGRCISTTHEAQASIRIMPICATLGEAAGTAVAVAHETKTNTHTVDVQRVRQRLRENGAAVE